MLRESGINAFSRGATQKHMGARQHRDRPWEAPAVAMKERQRPQIHGMVWHLPGHHIVDRIGPGAAMGIHHALRLAGRAGCVIQGQRIPLIIRRGVRKIGRTLCQQGFIGQLTNTVAARPLGVLDINDEQIAPGVAHRLSRQGGELGINEQYLGLAVLENKTQCGSIEPDVVGIQHGAQHGDRQCAFQGFRDIGRDQRHGVTFANASLRKRGR